MTYTITAQFGMSADETVVTDSPVDAYTAALHFQNRPASVVLISDGTSKWTPVEFWRDLMTGRIPAKV